MSRRRPLLRFHGGKWMLAPWIIGHFPPHRIYVEPFGGAGSVLLRKPRTYSEVYNDLDGELVNPFTVARDRGEELVREVELTPFSRADFVLSFDPVEDPLERARRTVVRSFMGFGSNAHTTKTGFRSNSNRSGTTPAHDWRNWPEGLVFIIERLRGVVIENTDAIAVVCRHDTPETLHYVDPPYVHSTRTDGRADYAFEMTDDQHRELAEVLHSLSGVVVLSGYSSPLYDDLYADWYRTQRTARADGAAKRVEVLWTNRQTLDLFSSSKHQERP